MFSNDCVKLYESRCTADVRADSCVSAFLVLEQADIGLGGLARAIIVWRTQARRRLTSRAAQAHTGGGGGGGGEERGGVWVVCW